MTAPTLSPASPVDAAAPRAALASLMAWWDDAGVETIAPTAPHRTSSRSASGATTTHGAATGAPVKKIDARARLGLAPDKAAQRRAASGPVSVAPKPPSHDEILENARAIAAKCDTLEALKAALEGFDRHPLRPGARSTVFARGNANAPVMIVGEAPGRDEDRAGLPFVGRSGQLMDRMFEAIGLTADDGLYITNVVNWRPRENRNPNTNEIELCRPFIERHIALKKPKILVLAGGISAQALLGVTQGITRLRGKWTTYTVKDADGSETQIPVLPIYHPAYLLRRAIGKRDVWQDLLGLQERLKDL